MKSVRVRHVGYTPPVAGHPYGVPLYRKLPDAVCADSLPDYLGFRQFSYTPTGLPWLAYGWECCDVYSDDYVEQDCWPLGDGPGITRKVLAYVGDVQSCWSARDKRVELNYSAVADGGDGKWHGSVELRGGTLNLVFSCNPDAFPGEAGKFRLEWSGCDSGFRDQGYSCPDPLIVPFGNISASGCCDCHRGSPGSLAGGGDTEVQAEIDVTVVANCKRGIWVRHVGYTKILRGTGTIADHWVPVYAKAKPCDYDSNTVFGCGNMTCPLVMTVTGAGDCGCLSGTYDLDYEGGEWQNLGVGGCPSTAIFTLSCTELPGDYRNTGTDVDLIPNEEDPEEFKLVRLDLIVTCGDTNTGSASLVVPAYELENLDVTFTVPLVDPTDRTCSGDCQSTYNAMTATWTNTGSTCSEGCDPCPETPPAPYLPASPTDGQVVTFPCSGPGGVTPCCVGTISVRVMR